MSKIDGFEKNYKKLTNQIVKNKKVVNGVKRLTQRKQLIKNANTAFKVLADDGLASLRFYLPLQRNKQYKTPIVIVSPLAVEPVIYDLLPERSFIKTLLNQGHIVYLIDWGKPTREQSDFGFNYYVQTALPKFITLVKNHSQSKQVTLHGWSLGGVFSVLYTLIEKNNSVKNLILLGTPIDSHASGMLGQLCKMANFSFNQTEKVTTLHPRQLPKQLVHTNAFMSKLGFKVINPVGIIKNYIKLIENIEDDIFLVEHTTKSDFLINMYDYPGGIVKDMAVRFWIENAVFDGSYSLDNTIIKLENISANLLVISGNDDTIVTNACAQKIATTHNSNDVTSLKVNGGHLGILSSKYATKDIWPKVTTWLATRSF